MYIEIIETGVQAGFSSFVGDDESYKVSLEHYLIERPSTTICVRVKGESMIGAGIMPEDLALVDKGKVPLPGNIVIAIMDGCYTIKFLEKDKKGDMFLRSANKDFNDFYPESSLEIFGVVIGVVRKYA